jgi:hypothetical protein
MSTGGECCHATKINMRTFVFLFVSYGFLSPQFVMPLVLGDKRIHLDAIHYIVICEIVSEVEFRGSNFHSMYDFNFITPGNWPEEDFGHCDILRLLASRALMLAVSLKASPQ